MEEAKTTPPQTSAAWLPRRF